MKKVLFASLALAAIIFSQGCGKSCRDAACPNAIPPFFAFRITNSAKKDLLTGAFKVYDSAQLRINAKRVNSSTIESVPRFFNYSGDTLALTGFNVDEKYAVYYVQLNGTTTDSLYFRYNKNVNECCDLSNYSFIKHNSLTVSPVNLPASYVIVK